MQQGDTTVECRWLTGNCVLGKFMVVAVVVVVVVVGFGGGGSGGGGGGGDLRNCV